MKRILPFGVFALLALVALPEATQAQPAFAIGHPLPKPELPTGTVTVRVIAGSIAAPAVGAEVALVVAGQARNARTDPEGRATFSGLAPGTQVQAKITDAEGKPVASDEFPVPPSGGVGVMLSTKPMAGGPMGGPMAGNMPMMDPRKASGIPRAHPKEPAGSYSVRVTYASVKLENGEPKDPTPPVGETVTLLGYTSDDGIDMQQKKVDADGKATFDNLDPSGNTIYFALAALPRNGGVDRLKTQAVQLDNQSGVRAILSAEKRDSNAPPIDDFATPQTTVTPPGKVRVTIEGAPQEVGQVSLIDAATKKPIGTAAGGQIVAAISNVESLSQFVAGNGEPAGQVSVFIHGVGGGASGGFPDIQFAVVPADAQGAVEGVKGTTGADGTAKVSVVALGPQKVRYVIKGKEFTSDAFDPSKQGGTFEAVARWSEGREVLFDAPAGTVAYAETRIPSGRFPGTYHSLPFLTIPTAGVNVSLMVAPRLVFSFSLRSQQDDAELAVQGRWTIENLSWAPYRAGPDGLTLALPRGFKHGILANQQQSDIAVVAGEGFRLVRPIPPGRKAFIAGFSLPIEDGNVDWSWDLPFGAYASGIEFLKAGNMTFKGPQTPREAKDDQGRTWLVLDDLMIGRDQAMVMSIEGLPTQPSWKYWIPHVIGVIVILILGGGLAFALIGRPKAGATAGTRRQALLDELVELERSGNDPKRRDQVMAELERIWGG
jgi:hypothetical protein